jgi:hypothetical protein
MTGNNHDTNAKRKFDEFSPKHILLLVNQSARYLLSKWIILLIAGAVSGLLYIAFSYAKKPKYTADFVFALDEGAVKSSSNSLTALSEELGFGPSYDAGGVFSSVTNILELLQSRLLIEKTLKRSIAFGNKPVLFADFFLDSLEYRKKWMKGSSFEHIDFAKENPGREEEHFRNGILSNMYGTITSQFIKIDRKGKGTTLIQVSLTSEHEAFSKYFLEALIDEVSKYYIELKTYRSKLHLDFIQKRTDSMRDAYNQGLYGRSVLADANINPNRQIATVPGEKKQTDVQILRESYISLMKTLESERTSLMQETPLFQYLDKPLLPLKKTTNNLLVKFIIFFIIGSLLAAFILLLVKSYRFIIRN